MNNDMVRVQIKGHLKIVDDLGNILVDKLNAIHPENAARIITRALSNESNYFINRIAFGNGGTTTNAAGAVTRKTPNDGQSPDIATWDSRLYNEIYSEIVNTGSSFLGRDLGSADANVGVRPGRDDVASDDPASVSHVSGPGVRSIELGLTSNAVVHSVLNGNEPVVVGGGSFVFDEVGLYTSGLQAIDTSGYQYINVGNKLLTDSAGLSAGPYSFVIAVNGGTPVTITIPSGTYTYNDLCTFINTAGLPGGATMSITHGYLSVESSTSGISSSIQIGTAVLGTPTGGSSYTNGTYTNVPLTGGSGVGATATVTVSGTIVTSVTTFSSGVGYTVGDSLSALAVNIGGTGSGFSVPLVRDTNTSTFLAALNIPGTLLTPVQGTNAGVQNAPTTPSLERERLLTHLIFTPVIKAPGRTLLITYTLAVSLARTPS